MVVKRTNVFADEIFLLMRALKYKETLFVEPTDSLFIHFFRVEQDLILEGNLNLQLEQNAVRYTSIMYQQCITQ